MILTYHGINSLSRGVPGPSIPPYTIRLRFSDGVTPTFQKGTLSQVSASLNIWDLTHEDIDWTGLCNRQSELIEVIEANIPTVKWIDAMFFQCSALTTVDAFYTGSEVFTSGMFESCPSLLSVPLFDTSNVTDMGYMFSGCSALSSVPQFDTSKVTNMEGMFKNASTLSTVPLLNTANVTNMKDMFNQCVRLTTVPTFNTSSVTNMSGMFHTCTQLTAVPLLNTTKVTNVYNMFYSCTSVQSGALALYQQLSTQSKPPTSHYNTFYQCGANTVTGLVELNQIPTTWGGNMS